MQLCRKNNNFIINAAKHKGKREEKHAHVETTGLVKDQGKTPLGGKPFEVFFLLDCHKMFQQRV